MPREVPPILGLLLACLLGLFIAYQPSASYAVDLAEQRSEVEVEGAHAPEQNEEVGSYRWTRAVTNLRIRPIGAPLTVSVRLQGWRPEGAGNPRVVFSLDGRELARAETSNALQQIDIRIPRAEAVLSSLDLRMETQTFEFPGDARALGVLLAGVSAESGPGWPNLPNRAPAGQALAAVLLLYVAARLAGARRIGAFLLGCAGIAAVAVPLALDRALVAQWGWLWVVAAIVALALGAYWRTLSRFFGAVAGAMRRGTLPAPDTEPSADLQVPPRWLTPALVLCAALMVVLHLAAPLLTPDESPETNYRWGLDWYWQLPAAFSWGAALFLLLFMLPRANSAARSLFLAATTTLRGYVATTNPYPLLAIAGALSTLLFWLLRNQTPLGDSVELIRKIELNRQWHEREQLDYWIHLKLTQLLAGLGATPMGVYQVLSAIAGGLAVVGVLLLAARLAVPSRRWLVAGFALGTANMLLFAGYVESYTLASLAAIWFVLALLLYVQEKAPAGVPAFLLALAMWLHPSTAFLAPALLCGLLMAKASWRGRARDAAIMLAAGLLMTLLVATMFLFEGYSWQRWEVAQSQLGGVDPGMFKPLFEATGPREYYPVFSWAHLGAIIQQQLLIAPLALITAILSWIGLRRSRASREEVLLAVAAAFSLLFSATWNPDLGAAKDWDLLALPGIPLALLAGAALASRWPRAVDGSRGIPARLVYVGSVLVSVSLWHALAWILVNALGR